MTVLKKIYAHVHGKTSYTKLEITFKRWNGKRGGNFQQ